MSEHWMTIIKSRYDAGAITALKVQSYVPKLITQLEADTIINGVSGN